MESNIEISIETYSDKSFIVIGNTKKYRRDLKKLGGRFNKKLTNNNTGEVFIGWIYSNERLDNVKNFINSINNGHYEDNNEDNNESEFQLIKYNIIKPEENMRVILTFYDFDYRYKCTYTYKINSIKKHNDIIDTVFIEPIANNGYLSYFTLMLLHTLEILKLVIINGRWQALNFNKQHNIKFVYP